jgi:serine/threonine protein phosphatase PrpC
MRPLALCCVVETEVGRRATNEDAAFATSRVAVVADGVGGAASGEVASRWVVNSFITLDKSLLTRPLPEALSDTVRWANEALGFISACHPKHAGMASTVTAVALSEDGEYLVMNVGDSRTYLLRDGRLGRLTRDDSLVQELLDRGAITDAEARTHPGRSIVLAALDGQPRDAVRPTRVRARDGDRLLLCSDGLSDALDDQTIAETLTFASGEDCAHALIRLALKCGARDNISVIVADVKPRTDSGSGWLPALAR